MRSGLQRKLTLSHLVVTLISVAILVILILVGYLIYLRTDLSALWIGDQAYFIAEDIAYYLDGAPLSEQFSEDFIFDVGFDPITETDDPEDIYYEDWIIILDPEGKVVGSNDEFRYSLGSSLDLEQLPGFDLDLFQTPASELVSEDPYDLVAYAVEGKDHIGMAAIINYENEHIGWIFYRAGGVDAPVSSTQTITALVVVLISAALIATLISGIAGGWLSLSFSRRLRMMSQVSEALAEGDLSRRVSIQGTDEIDQLGVQFNSMADQLATQMHDLRTLADHNAMLAEEAQALASIEERNRLARELHDAVKQQIFALSLTANSVRQLLEKDTGLATERLAQLEEQAQDVHLEMDALIKQLRPASLRDQGLTPAISEIAKKWEIQHEIPIELSIRGERELPLNIEQALYRIAQEALNNIARHAKAGQISIVLEYDTNQVSLCVKDNGMGFDLDARRPPQSLGLRSMDERAAEVDGQLDIRSSHGTGTQVQIIVPTR
ncbi:MAG: sensor histidine kinase [Anaerolineales bacterium]|nr:sensor histidine kinase [Chloroflexota bacterium]MBL6981283.1 sensor histidine kinase [Anaerolineales bacterium]